jgi:S-(hydroxymethyl)glutathione dehydrogenase/alcohol dehydrogenase
MRITAAVLREFKKPYTIEELELEPPKTGEVLVKIAYCGYCHSDLSHLTGVLPLPLPAVIGHECSGIVEDVGPGVTKLKKGDHIVGTFSVPCGECFQCQSGNRNQCSAGYPPFLEGTLLDGTTRFRDRNGNSLHHDIFLSGFSTYTVLPEGAAIPVPLDLPLEHACLLGCCVPTGWGSVTNIAKVRPGNSVAVFGLGGVGLNVLRAAVLRQAHPVIAVDLEESKESLAYEFGATHFICSAKEDPVPRIQSLTEGRGAQIVFEAIGDPGAIVQAWWSTGICGKLVIPGITPMEQTTNLPLFILPLHQRQILGSGYGDISPGIDIPNLARMAAVPDLLKLDKLVTKKFALEEINVVAEAMAKRQVIGRWICAFE